MFGLRPWFVFEVEAPIDAVWEYCENEAYLPEYMPQVKAVVVEEKTATVLRYSIVLASGERHPIASTILRSSPPHEYVTRTSRVFYDLVAGYRLTELAPGRIRVAFLADYELSRWQWIAHVLAAPFAILFYLLLYLILRGTFRRFKQVIEAKAKAKAFRGYRE